MSDYNTASGIDDAISDEDEALPGEKTLTMQIQMYTVLLHTQHKAALYITVVLLHMLRTLILRTVYVQHRVIL